MGAIAVLAATSRRAERAIIEHLRREGATRPERAARLPELRHHAGRRLQRLLNAQVVHEHAGRYWLDENMYAGFRDDRRSLALVMLAIAATTALGMILSKLL